MVHIIPPTRARWQGAETLRQTLDTLGQPEHDMVVSWGVDNLGRDALNGGARVSNLDQQLLLRDAGLGVDVTTDLEEAKEWTASGSCVIGRLRYHTKAKDVVLPNHTLWPTRDYWVRVIEPPFDEWRIHVCLDKVIARGLKTKTGEERLRFPARNRRNGWTLSHKEEPPRGIRRAAKEGISVIGYDFGGVDIIHKVVGGVDKFHILECNRAPGLDNYTATAYAKAFIRIAKGEWDV